VAGLINYKGIIIFVSLFIFNKKNSDYSLKRSIGMFIKSAGILHPYSFIRLVVERVETRLIRGRNCGYAAKVFPGDPASSAGIGTPWKNSLVS
jgi:hypothetical protein